MSDPTDKPGTPGVRPEDARWWLAQWRREQGIEAQVQEWLDGPFSQAVEAAATRGKSLATIRLACTAPLKEAIEDRLYADGWDVYAAQIGAPGVTPASETWDYDFLVRWQKFRKPSK